MRKLEAVATAAGGPIRPGAPDTSAYAVAGADPKHMSTATTMTGPGSPMMPGYGQQPGYSPAFGYAQPQHVMQDPYGGHGQGGYGIQQSPMMQQGYPQMGMQGYPGMSPPLSQSPPPPSYPYGIQKDSYSPAVAPVEVDGGDVPVSANFNRQSTGFSQSGVGSDARSQVTSTTAVGSNDRSNAAELTSSPSVHHRS